ncbi:MAG: glycosyltransferase family 2 protein [Bacteroidota bacterium]
MTITVVTVCYNSADQLPATLDSIRQQDYPKLESIVVDGGSTDGTQDILAAWRKTGVRVLSEPDQGVYDAMNKGVQLATGRYVHFLNAGDRFFAPDTVSQVAARIKSDDDYVYGDVISEYAKGEKHATARPPAYLWRNKPFNHQALFAARSYLREIPFDLSYPIVADYQQTFAAHHAGARLRHLDGLTVARVAMAEGLSKRDFWATVREKISVNWRMSPHKSKTLLYLLGHLPYQAGIYLLHRLDVFERVMVWRGKAAAKK